MKVHELFPKKPKCAASGQLGRKGVKQGRIWAYVRDQRPWAGTAPPGAVYYFAPDRKGDHVRQHLQNSSGILQADAYAGFNALYEKDSDGKASSAKPPAGRT